MIAGDILLVNDYSGQGDLIGNLIRAGERVRYGKEADTTQWTHSAMIVSKDGDLVEALERGVCRTHIGKYKNHVTKIISPPGVPASDPRRAYAARYALAQVGESYGVLGFISLAVDLLFGLNTGLHIGRQPICSEVCARATESCSEAGYQYPSERMMPSDLDVYYGAPVGKPVAFFGRVLLLAQCLWWALSPFKKGIRP